MPIDQHSTVLVTGATGFVGRSLVHQLRKRNCRIKVLAREGSAVNALASNYQAELIHGNILSKTAVQTACEKITHVFHLAGRGQSGESAESAEVTRQINVDGTKLLAEAAAKAPDLERFLHLSTIAVHGNVTNGPADETADFSAISSYELSKLEAELWLTNFATQNQLPVTILRPCAIVGPGDQRLLKLFKLANQWLVPLPGSGRNRYQIIHIDDCIAVMLAAAQANNTIGETYVCGNSATLTLREILRLTRSDAHKREALLVPLPIQPAKWVLSVMEKLCSTLGISTPLPASRLAFFEQSHWFDTGKILKDLGVELSHDNESALRTTRDWYIESQWL